MVSRGKLTVPTDDIFMFAVACFRLFKVAKYQCVNWMVRMFLELADIFFYRQKKKALAEDYPTHFFEGSLTDAVISIRNLNLLGKLPSCPRKIRDCRLIRPVINSISQLS